MMGSVGQEWPYLKNPRSLSRLSISNQLEVLTLDSVVDMINTPRFITLKMLARAGRTDRNSYVRWVVQVTA